MVVSMVDVGEQTGAMPEMLLKIADNYDEEVDNAVSAMTSLLEPIMIIFLAVIVGSIVIAMFLPLIAMISQHEQWLIMATGNGGRRITSVRTICCRKSQRIIDKLSASMCKYIVITLHGRVIYN